MAPNKFVEQLKDKLEKRSIQPSQDAWSTLNDRLDANNNKQNNKGFWWIGIAATIVGVWLVFTFVFKSNTEIVEPTIVDTQDENVIDTEVLQNKNVLKDNNELAVEQEDKVQTNKTSQKKKENQVIKSPLKSVIKEQNGALIPNKVDETVTEVKTKLKFEETSKNTTEKNTEIVSFEDQKVKDVVAKIQQLQKGNKEVSSEEIDALLETAQKEITMHKLYNEATKTVDADALLKSVEDDLEQSFRSKVFEAIKSGYNTVKTAVAERNN